MDIQGKNFLQLGARLLYFRPIEGCYVEVILISLCTAHIKLKWKLLFDGKARLDIQSHYRGALPGKPLCPSVPKMGTDGQSEWLLCTLSIMTI